jgi:hypothetical protein
LSRSRLNTGVSWFAILAAEGVICAGASATPITITQTINLSQDLSASSGGTYSGTFNINSLLPTTGDYTDPLQLLTASVAVFGYSNPNATLNVGAYSAYQQSYAGSYYYSYQYVAGYYSYTYYSSWGGSCWNGCTTYAPYYATAYVAVPIYDETQYRTNTNLDSTTDSVTLSTGGGTTISGADARTVTDLGTTLTAQSQGGGGGSPYYYYYSYTDTVDDFVSGGLSASGALTAASLALLSQDGTLSYSVMATSGQFNLSQLTLTVTLDQSPAPAPEPGTLPIFGFGLLLIAWRARMVYRPTTRF